MKPEEMLSYIMQSSFMCPILVYLDIRHIFYFY